MQVVIEIPEKEYERMKAYAGPMAWAEYLIVKGTPLPKGHGRLIDASNLLTVTDYDGENEKTYVSYDEIENALTIIEADKENEK